MNRVKKHIEKIGDNGCNVSVSKMGRTYVIVCG
jgi:biotin operon repressor